MLEQPTPKYKIGNKVRLASEKWYNPTAVKEIVGIRITMDGVWYFTKYSSLEIAEEALISSNPVTIEEAQEIALAATEPWCTFEVNVKQAARILYRAIALRGFVKREEVA